jgi:multicomponent Na+:H+ antiporter subunit G
MIEVFTNVLLLVGATFLLLAAVGLLRMPDLFMRMSAATKGTTLGIGCMLLAVGVHFPGLGITTRAVVGILFFFVTAPVAAHLIARAAYFIGVPLWRGTVRDDLLDRYDPVTHELKGRFEDLAGLGRGRRGPPTVIRIGRRPNGRPPEGE